MATLKIIRNGVKRRANPKRKRVANPRSSSPVLKSVANPKRRSTKRRRRNGIVTRRRNGILGDTKRDVKNVVSLTGGAITTNVLGNTLAGMIAPYLSSVGIGNYASIVSQLAIALFGVPYVARALGGQDAASMARLGGLLSVTLDVLGTFFPSFNSLNPFASAPIVVGNSGQVAVSPAAVKAIAGAAANETAQKVAGAMELAQSAGMGWSVPTQYLNGNLVT